MVVDTQSSAKSSNRTAGEVLLPHQRLKQGDELRQCSRPQHSFGACAEVTAKTTNRSPRTKRVEPAPSDTKFLASVDKHRRIRPATRKFFSEPLADFSCDLGHLVGD